jgi:tRNA(Glu) U13 pseudouridine synthase TruD
MMANNCRCEEKRFGFAGTKDRRGRTVQRLSAAFIGAKQLLGKDNPTHSDITSISDT